MYKAKGVRDKKGKLVGGAFMMNNRAGDQTITAETGAFRDVNLAQTSRPDMFPLRTRQRQPLF